MCSSTDVPTTPLQKTLKVGGFTAKLYHKEQPKRPLRELVCFRCLETGHWVGDCPNDVTCRECHKSGHKRGDPACGAMDEEPVLPESVWAGEPHYGDTGLFVDPDGTAADGREDDDDEWELSRSEVSTEATNTPATDKDHPTSCASLESSKKDIRDTDDQERKQALVERGRRLINSKQHNGKQTKLYFDTRPRSATPNDPRSRTVWQENMSG